MSKNLFSDAIIASLYSQFRPSPPKLLISHLIKYVSNYFNSNDLSVCVDVGCGSGQCTKLLAPHFKRVYGYDSSAAQINTAIKYNTLSNVNYDVSPAEQLPVVDNSVQLVTASQSFHWFDLNQFYSQTNRILVRRGVLALIGYRMPSVSHLDFPSHRSIDNLVNEFYSSPLLLWDKNERQMVDSSYTSVVLPFTDFVRNDSFVSHSNASAHDLKGYIMSWSGYNKLRISDHLKAQQFLLDYDNLIKSIFGDIDMKNIEFQIHFNFFLLMSRKDNNL